MSSSAALSELRWSPTGKSDRSEMDQFYIHRLTTAFAVAGMLPNGNIPATESQVRPLTTLEPQQ